MTQIPSQPCPVCPAKGAACGRSWAGLAATPHSGADAMMLDLVLPETAAPVSGFPHLPRDRMVLTDSSATLPAVEPPPCLRDCAAPVLGEGSAVRKVPSLSSLRVEVAPGSGARGPMVLDMGDHRQCCRRRGCVGETGRCVEVGGRCQALDAREQFAHVLVRTSTCTHAAPHTSLLDWTKAPAQFSEGLGSCVAVTGTTTCNLLRDRPPSVFPPAPPPCRDQVQRETVPRYIRLHHPPSWLPIEKHLSPIAPHNPSHFFLFHGLGYPFIRGCAVVNSLP